MLVLSRKEGQQVQIGDDIVVTVTRIKGNWISLGIDAPKDVAITRPDETKQERIEVGPTDA